MQYYYYSMQYHYYLLQYAVLPESLVQSPFQKKGNDALYSDTRAAIAAPRPSGTKRCHPGAKSHQKSKLTAAQEQGNSTTPKSKETAPQEATSPRVYGPLDGPASGAPEDPSPQ